MMLSVADYRLYPQGEMARLENALLDIRTVNVFTDSSILSALRADTLKALDEGRRRGLEKYLC